MPRLLVHVEGPTEEDFVKEVLRPHLTQHGFSSVGARLVGNPRLRSRRGGIRSWESVLRDVLRHLRQDSGAIATTMVDYYGMPPEWPGRQQAPIHKTTATRAEHVERALLADVTREMGNQFDGRRFLPFVMMHEFEALLFSDPAQFANSVGMPHLASGLHKVRGQFFTPEDINDSVTTAPSKRIKELLPRYEKPLFGVIGVLGIGLARIRQECPHFHSWLVRLEGLPQECAYLG